LPTKQYQCGKKFVESRARELNQTAAVAHVSVSNPSLTVRGVKPTSDFVSIEALADMRSAAFPSSHAASTLNAQRSSIVLGKGGVAARAKIGFTAGLVARHAIERRSLTRQPTLLV